MPSDTGDVHNVFSRHLDSRGDETGVVNANGLYADSVVTFTNATNVVNLTTHGFVAGDGPFQFTTTGSLPAELDLLTDYYVGPTVGASTFEVSLTRGGAVVPFTDDGSATTTIETPFRFYCEAQTGQILRIDSLIVHIEDATGFVAEDYGSLGAALTVGVSVHTESTTGSTLIDLTSGVPVKSNGEWGKFCFGTELVLFGAGNDFLQAEWTWPKMPIRLAVGERLVVTCHDDMDGLAAHNFVAHGYNELS